MRYKFWNHRMLLVFVLALSSFSLIGQDLDAGKKVFRANCAACHAGDMKTKLTGPALGGSQERWADYGGDEALYSWIRNSQALVGEGNERAIQVYEEFNKSVMTSFLNLSDEEIANLLGYIEIVYQNGPYPPVVIENAGGGAVAVSKDNTWLYIGLALVLGLLALVLMRIVINLKEMIQVKETGKEPEPQTVLQTITNSGVVNFAVFAIVIFGGYLTVSSAIDLGRQQGYQPIQPIKFSHKTHAGTQQIDCQYCHDGARRSKHSVIPAANTCMNCHRAIKVGSTYGTAEISKIYASIGYDPSRDLYIPDYEDMSNEDILEVYRKWITAEGDTDDVEGQLEAIEAALTDKELGDDKIAGPINWTRVYNLPDHVYYNHSQHVNVGGLECQTCHGPVEEMDVVKAHVPLSMGWCVNCHRETEVQFAGNEYYKDYELYHEQLKDGTRTGVTVEEIGGLECQKCHY